MKAWLHTVGMILFDADTKPVRFWLALIDITFALQLYVGADLPGFENAWRITSTIAPADARWVWIIGFFLHAGALLVGLTGKYNFWTLLIEGVMGWALWVVMATILWAGKGVPGAALVGALLMTWILIRYPTHWTRWGRRDD